MMSIRRRPFDALFLMLASRLAHAFTTCPLPLSLRHSPRDLLQRSAAWRRFLSNEPMENLYQEWTLSDDRLLWEHRNQPLPTLASLLGRGLRGVESRLTKLSNVDTPAYQRLFCHSTNNEQDVRTSKLVPAGEILRRIQWDHSLVENDFSIMYYDRVDDKLEEISMDAPNTSISSKEKKFVLAVPEHRIAMIKYKERIVWDRVKRIDCVFGSVNGNRETIDQVMIRYPEWKRNRDAELEWDRQRQKEVSDRIQQILGLERNKWRTTSKHPFNSFVKSATTPNHGFPTTDEDALDAFFELTALSPNETLRATILNEIASRVSKSQPSLKTYVLPELREEELTETFVRGSGAGGQKINKTSNRVVLVHEPTQLRVECQETRSLQQNPKIARKRLQLILDQHLHGFNSKTSILAEKQVAKKSKAKARSSHSQVGGRIASIREQVKGAARVLSSLVTVHDDNQHVVGKSDIVFITVLPQQTSFVLQGLTFDKARHSLVSLVSTSTLDGLASDSKLPAEQVSKVICLPSVARHQSVSLVVPKQPHNPILTDMLASLGGFVECETEDTMSVMMVVSGLMGGLYGTLRNNRDWLVRRGVSPQQASYYVGRQYWGMMQDALYECDNPSRFDDLVEEQTPGGLNEQALDNLEKLGVFGAYDTAMDALLSRLEGKSDGSLLDSNEMQSDCATGR